MTIPSMISLRKYRPFIICLVVYLNGSMVVGQSNTGIDNQSNISDKNSVILLFDQNCKLPDLSGLDKESKGILVYQKLSQCAEASQKEVRSFLDSKKISYKCFCIVNAMAVEVDSDLILQLRGFSQVKQILLDAGIREPELVAAGHLINPGRSLQEIPWGLELIQADAVWDMGFRGQGVTVGGHDTGVDWQHPALVNQYRGLANGMVDHNYNWHDAIHQISALHQDSLIDEMTNPCGLNLEEPCDDAASSHGTHTMGTMVGFDPETQITTGVAPQADWIAVRNMERGFGSVSSYLEGFEWFLAPTDLEGLNPDPTRAPDVINNSWACIEIEGCEPGNFSILENAIDMLRAAGIMVVASAGNGGAAGCGSINAPAAIYEGSLTVGSVDSNDSLSGFSSRGPVLIDGRNIAKPNVSAPGRSVLSSIKGSNMYGLLSGTSMAGPHVAGLVALIVSANPELRGQVEMIEDIIESTAIRKLGKDSCVQESSANQVPNSFHGYGRIDALTAVQLAINTATTTKESGPWIKMELFPNPSRGSLYVELAQPIHNGRIMIVDVLGHVVYEEKVSFLENDSFRVSGLPPGTFYLQIYTDEALMASKVFNVIP